MYDCVRVCYNNEITSQFALERAALSQRTTSFCLNKQSKKKKTVEESLHNAAVTEEIVTGEPKHKMKQTS